MAISASMSEMTEPQRDSQAVKVEIMAGRELGLTSRRGATDVTFTVGGVVADESLAVIREA